MKKTSIMTSIMKKILIISTLFLSLTVFACGNKGAQASKSTENTTNVTTENAQTKAKIVNVHADEFEKLMAEHKNAILLDVRTPQEYAEGHLENAKLHNVFDNFEAVAEELAKKEGTDKPVLVYCRSGRRSMRAAEILKNKGFKTIYNLQGGIMEWSSAGKKIVK